MNKWWELLVTVCSKCKQASCWQGKFFCDEAIKAGTVQMRIIDLIRLNTGEHPCYWITDQKASDE